MLSEGNGMYKKIMVALSLEHGIAERALQAAHILADKDAEVIAVHVHEPLQGSVKFHVSDEDIERSKKQTRALLAERTTNHPEVKSVILEGHAGRTLSDYAARIGADCIIVASHKPGLRDYLLGSTAARTVRHAPCSVHVLR